MKKIKICYTDFWSDFIADNTNNYFTKLLSERYEVEVVDNNSDLLIYSVFGDNYKNIKDCKKVFFTGENRKPYGDYNIAYSFNYEEDSSHIRLPLYSYFCYEENNINKITTKTKTLGNNFCSFMVGNLNHGEGSKLRVEFFEKLSKYKKVLSSGRSLKNIEYKIDDQNGTDDWRQVKYKILNLEQPKFMITFENSSSIGYTTEKIYDALINGIVPIYWGNPSIERDFNPNSFINIENYKSVDDAIEYIIELDKNEKEYNKLLDSSIVETDEQYEYFNNTKILDSLSNLIEHKQLFSGYDTFKHPNTIFDCIYCLNLEKRNDRWINVNERFKRENIHVKRIEGIDKESINIDEYNEILINKTNKTISNIGSYAILKSFRKILYDFKNSDYEKILIFEDDVTFHKDFIYLFNLQYNLLPDEWSLWYLGGSQQNLTFEDDIKYVNNYLYHPINMDGNFAIAINRNILDELLNLIDNNNYPLDSLIKEYIQPFNKNIYTSNPFICGHSMDDYSDNWEITFTIEYIKKHWKNRYYDKKIYG